MPRMSAYPHLLAPLDLGFTTLPNRVLMAPLTRLRAGDTNIPNALMAAYYRQRASAGLILTEATPVSPQGIGYQGVPGIWSKEQVEGWKQITRAVHEAVVVVVVLPIMLLFGDAPALHILRLMDACPLTRCNNAIGLGPGFHVLDSLLSCLETARFTRCQFARRNALLDARFLIDLALIDDRRIRLGNSGNGNGGGKHGYEHLGLHVFLSCVWHGTSHGRY